MSRTPAAELARVKAAYPQWSIRRVTGGDGYTAWHQATGEHAWAPDLAALEARLRRPATAGSSPQ